jgi:50S ribosomal protein L16 3-hydroxylase
VNRTLLGGMSASIFLRRHWHKTPLLVRNAIPGFAGLLDLRGMIDLASRDDCESRLVVRSGRDWKVEHGPFAPARFRRLPSRNWTLLVQGVDLFLPEARQLLSQFSFIPYSRLDDLMVSYAAPGGGVGPHFDSYDVFLLQGPGRRRWQVSRQRGLALRKDIALKVLERFRPEGEAVLEPGDMLYLPPQFAHDGTALGDCYTYSIGFRAPSHRELASEFLMFLEERLRMPGRYADPELALQDHPAEIGPAMIRKVGKVLRAIRWSGRDTVDFLGSYLTEPKQQVRFVPPARPLTPGAFSRAARRSGVRLQAGSQMLYSGARIFINGEVADAGAVPGTLHRLANVRALPGRSFPRDRGTAELLYAWYRAGYISLNA